MKLRAHIKRQRRWSRKNIGPGQRVEGILKHIEKEVTEVRANPTDLMEWIDIAMLAFDGAWRQGFSARQIESALAEKLEINKSRKFPMMPEDEPSFHEKKEDA